jgi:hypothetical protein
MGIILMSRSGFAVDGLDLNEFEGNAKSWTQSAWSAIVLILNIVCVFTALWNIWEGTMGKGEKAKAWMNILYIAIFFSLINNIGTFWNTLTKSDLMQTSTPPAKGK